MTNFYSPQPPEPPKTCQDLCCVAANAQSLTGKAHAPDLERRFMRSQTSDFPQNRRVVDIRCRRERAKSNLANRTVARFSRSESGWLMRRAVSMRNWADRALWSSCLACSASINITTGRYRPFRCTAKDYPLAWLKPHPFQRRFCACLIRSRPFSVFGPVLNPPCMRQRRLPGTTRAWHASPALVFAPHPGRRASARGSP
ncbi:hypothetical protein SAMN05443432_11912 [Roseovarius litoreus]|uniref:Uncharacterized protein n=1 Tax=Roseovarius litoreus TaxID=1155722 RepID=A0A1M7LQE9_9RHOB|nr:hypothetical protein SAMN05443432_11912 [Roseovarius litoreus]